MHYHYVTYDEFQTLVSQDAFIENAQFAGKCYGTSFAAVKDVTAKGRVCILDIEMEGVKQVKKSDLVARFVFVKPPSMEDLEKRLRGRGTEDEESLQKRLDQAKKELEFAETPGIHDEVIVNDDLDRAYGQLETYIMGIVGGSS